MSGSQIRCSVHAGDRLVALLSFGASAWKLADRERFIGWGHEQRQRNLQRIVNNARFLIPPWIQSTQRAWPRRSWPLPPDVCPWTGRPATATDL